MKKYVFEDLRAMSQPAREMWMCDQCSEFGKELENLISNREKECFAEEMHRKLRQLTKRWTSWNHKSFGNVTSRRSIDELFAWEQGTKLVINPLIKTANITPEQNVLKRFQELCKRLEELYESFTNDILEPMCDFFYPSSQNSKLDNNIASLRELLSRWKALLAEGSIDHTLFSEASSKYLDAFILRGRSYNYDSVIRLVPDLLEKAYLALSLSRKWRLLYKDFCITKEGTYTLLESQKVSKKEKQEHWNSHERIGLLEKQSDEAQTLCSTLNTELEKCQDRCKSLEKDLVFYTAQCERLEMDVENAKGACDQIKEKLEKVKRDRKQNSEYLTNSQQYCQVLQQELNASKIKYCTQKIKLINAKKRCMTLADQLDKATKEYETMRMEGEISQKKYHMMRTQLENFRRSIVTQGSMVDTLQQQCYNLKKELDSSKSRCKNVSEDLNETKARCETLESSLLRSEEERKMLELKLEKAVTRETFLRKENAELRETCKAQELTTDESCSLNTPVER